MLTPAKKTVILKDPPPQQTKSGLEYTPSGKNVPEMGVVVAYGKGIRPVAFEEGDTIVYRRYTDNKIFIAGESYNFIRFEDVLAVKEKE